MYSHSDNDDNVFLSHDSFPESEHTRETTAPNSEDTTDNTLSKRPNRSVFNLIYDNVDEDDDGMSHSTRSYLEEEDCPLPIITDSESSIWSRCGQCCDCCDAFLRKKRFRCKCGWVKNMMYYLVINTMLALFFLFVMYMTQVNYYQNPEEPPFKQLLFKTYQYPGVAMVPIISNEYSDASVMWCDASSKNENLHPKNYVKKISKLIHKHVKACETSKRCTLALESWGPCQTSDYGYSELKPCFLLKLNKLTLWEPEEYVSKSEIPENVPNDLRSNIETDSARLWINCRGETSYDEEKIGKVDYYPGQYFNSSFFPLSSESDTNPIVAIRLSELKSGYIAKLVCGVYAKNVHEPDAAYIYVYVK